MVDIVSLIGTTGGAFLTGILAGFAARKLFNLLAVIIGLQIAFFAYLEHLDLIYLNWSGFERIGDTIHEMILTLSMPADVETSELATAGGTVGGFLLGVFVGFYYA